MSFTPIGQSFTVVAPGPVNSIVINFFTDNTVTTPSALGTAFLLSSAYAGTPAALSGATPGFLGQATASGGFYNFNPVLTLLPGVQYFVYTDSIVPSAGSGLNPYAGGNIFAALTGPNSPYTAFPNADAAFVVDGTLVPSGAPELTLDAASVGIAVTGLCLLSVRRRAPLLR